VWGIDVSGPIPCAGPTECYQRVYEERTDYALCSVVVSPVFTGQGFGHIKGIIAITASALSQLPTDRDERCDVVWQRFTKYFCRYRPESAFVFELKHL
jgi:hypothetical protein